MPILKSADIHDPYHHVPNLSTFDGILDLVSLCCLMELGNVLNEWSYTGGKEKERRRLMYARKRGRKLIHWLFDQWELLDDQNKPIDAFKEFYWPFLAQQARALVFYKQSASDQGIHHSEIPRMCSVKKVKTIVEQSVMSPDELWNLYSQSNDVDATFAWTGTWFKVRKIEDPVQRKVFKMLLIITSLSTIAGDYQDLAGEGYTIDDTRALAK